MDNNIIPNQLRLERLGPPPLPQAQTPAVKPSPAEKPNFAEHLQRACADLGCDIKLSGHARERVNLRGINMSQEQITRLNQAVNTAAEKGAQKALVMLDDMALIVGLNQRAVITVVDGPALRENVFTAIDAAVIA